MKKFSTIIHIAIIIVGIAFTLLSNFYEAMWFDESYSVAISAHSFGEIWSIGGHDVHPVLYYWILHILRLIFGNNIIVFKLFSAICISILGIIGFTHVRKDFGSKVGMLFSFFVFFLPLNIIYAGQIRMYPLAMLFVALTAIYAYRIYKNSKIECNKLKEMNTSNANTTKEVNDAKQENSLNKNSMTDSKNNNSKNKGLKNWILFTIFSLAGAYTHYYALAASVVINAVFMIYLIIQAKQEKKFTTNLKIFILCGIIQILAYIPWLVYLLLQAKQVSQGYWIEMRFPDTFIEMFTFQFTGNLVEQKYVPDAVSGIYGVLVCAIIVYLFIKNRAKEGESKEKNLAPKIAIVIYLLVIIAVCVASLIVGRSILYARYLLCITGLFIFFISFILGKYGNKIIISVVCGITLIISSYINYNLIQINHDESNMPPIEYLEENIQEGDIIVYGNEGQAFVVSAHFPDVQQYFWDQAYWNVDEAYKAYGPNMQIIHDLDILEDYHGRIWVINATNYAIANSIEEEFGANVVEKREYITVYEDYKYTIALVEK